MEKLISWYKSNSVFVWTLLIAIGVIVFGAAYSSTLGEISGAFMSWVSYYFGWLYILSIVAFIGFCLWISLSKYGSVKLGGDDEKPEFSTFSWYAMLFCGSTGIGLVFWSIAEPLSHYAAPPVGIELGTMEAIDFSTELNRPFSFLYGTEQLMTIKSTIFNAEPYADLRVRCCMDWSVEPQVRMKNDE